MAKLASTNNSGKLLSGATNDKLVVNPSNTPTSGRADSVQQPVTGPEFQQNLQDLIEQRAQELLQEQLNAANAANTGKVFTNFNALNDIIDSQKQVITSGIWSDGAASLVNHFTSSTETATQKQYYFEVKQSGSAAINASTQYFVAYGHKYGSGSSAGSVYDSPSKAIYSQYKQLLLGPTDEQFTFGTRNSNHIYVVNFSRARMKQRLDPGNWQLNLAELNGLDWPNAEYTSSHVSVSSSNKVIQLIDDSGDSTQAITTYSNGRSVYNVVSGSITNGVYSTDVVGLVYPDYGVIILDADYMNVSCSFNTVTSSNADGENGMKLFKSISGSAVINSSYGFTARNSEVVSSTFYVVRINGRDYNFSNNPSYTSGSVGEFRQTTFIGDPKSYITTIGLYNDKQELMAVAKLSQPLLKSFTTDYTIRVKLDY